MPNLNKAYSWAIQTCNAPNVGYSQRYRNQQTVNGITYYDCSSFIWYALINGGFDMPLIAGTSYPFTTSSMASILIKAGFTEVDAKGIWLNGDIGLTVGHTEMVYKGQLAGGVCMGAHTDNASLANQVSIGSSSGNPNYVSTYANFPRIFRYGSGGAEGYGYSIYVISALCGNAWRESNINPGLNEVGGGGFGLFQWTGERRVALIQYLTSQGLEPTNPNGQMEFLLVEDDWSGSFGGISSLTEFMNSTSDNIPMLTEAFMTCWERPGVPALEERIQHAHECYDFIVANAQNSDINSWVIADRYLTVDEILNNAVMLYRYYSAGGGSGGNPSGKGTDMPLWMKIRYRL